jgi:hypothetical protein
MRPEEPVTRIVFKDGSSFLRGSLILQDEIPWRRWQFRRFFFAACLLQACGETGYNPSPVLSNMHGGKLPVKGCCRVR